MQVVLNIKGSFRTTGGGHNREVVALYRWPIEQVPLYSTSCELCVIKIHKLRIETQVY